jgi:hypothetical protein
MFPVSFQSSFFLPVSVFVFCFVRLRDAIFCGPKVCCQRSTYRQNSPFPSFVYCGLLLSLTSMQVTPSSDLRPTLTLTQLSMTAFDPVLTCIKLVQSAKLNTIGGFALVTAEAHRSMDPTSTMRGGGKGTLFAATTCKTPPVSRSVARKD